MITLINLELNFSIEKQYIQNLSEPLQEIIKELLVKNQAIYFYKKKYE